MALLGGQAARADAVIPGAVSGAGEVVVFNINGRDIPIVHRVIKVHERAAENHLDILTKVRTHAAGARYQQQRQLRQGYSSVQQSQLEAAVLSCKRSESWVGVRTQAHCRD